MNNLRADESPPFWKQFEDRKPRTGQDKCLLCLQNQASSVKSHIIPNFFTKSIFNDPAKRRVILSNGLGLRLIRSTTPKEAYLLCDSCEKRTGALETLISLVLPNLLADIRRAPNLTAGGFHIQLHGIDPSLFHLFVYSMLWRAEVCQQPQFQSLSVSKDNTELLRQLLNTCLSTNRSDMIQAFQDTCPNPLPIQYQAFTFSQEPSRESRLILGTGWGYNSSSGPWYRIFANEMFFVFSDARSLKQNAFSYVKEVLAISAVEWESIADDMSNTMVELNKLISE